MSNKMPEQKWLTVEQLIELLSRFDPAADVCLYNYKPGMAVYTPLTGVFLSLGKVCLKF